MGHAIAGVEGVYDRHSYVAEKAEALQRLAATLTSIVILHRQMCADYAKHLELSAARLQNRHGPHWRDTDSLQFQPVLGELNGAGEKNPRSFHSAL